MSRKATICEALTIGQLAKRWGIGRDHVKQLIVTGRLTGVFAIPSAGRYGEVTKIPLASILQAEKHDWLVRPDGKQKAGPRRKRNDASGPALKHFAKLNVNLEPDGESPSTDQH